VHKCMSVFPPLPTSWHIYGAATYPVEICKTECLHILIKLFFLLNSNRIHTCRSNYSMMPFLVEVKEVVN
jgi:hypothetical protein